MCVGDCWCVSNWAEPTAEDRGQKSRPKMCSKESGGIKFKSQIFQIPFSGFRQVIKVLVNL